MAQGALLRSIFEKVPRAGVARCSEVHQGGGLCGTQGRALQNRPGKLREATPDIYLYLLFYAYAHIVLSLVTLSLFWLLLSFFCFFV